MSLKIYKIISQNTEQYYIAHSSSLYLSSVLQQFVFKYKKFLNDNKLFHPVFNIIDFNDISIVLLFDNILLDNINIIIQQYLTTNEKCINNNTNINIINKLNDIVIIKNNKSINKQDYLKKYYENNKNKYIKSNNEKKEYYKKNKNEIKQKSKLSYNEKINKKNKKISMNINTFFNEMENNSD
jgi:hypothetical protein